MCVRVAGGSVSIKGKQGRGIVACSAISVSLLKPKLSSRFWDQGQWVVIVPYSTTGEGRLMWRAVWRFGERCREHHTQIPSSKTAGSEVSKEGCRAVPGWLHPIAAVRKPVSL